MKLKVKWDYFWRFLEEVRQIFINFRLLHNNNLEYNTSKWLIPRILLLYYKYFRSADFIEIIFVSKSLVFIHVIKVYRNITSLWGVLLPSLANNLQEALNHWISDRKGSGKRKVFLNRGFLITWWVFNVILEFEDTILMWLRGDTHSSRLQLHYGSLINISSIIRARSTMPLCFKTTWPVSRSLSRAAVGRSVGSGRCLHRLQFLPLYVGELVRLHLVWVNFCRFCVLG